MLNNYMLGFLGGNIICLDFWGRKSGPFIYALHFSLSLGLLIGPFVIEPLAQTHVPKMVQNLAIQAKGGTTQNHSFESHEKDTYHKNYHRIVKRNVLSLQTHGDRDPMPYNHTQSIASFITPDPLLVKLFAATKDTKDERFVNFRFSIGLFHIYYLD